MFEKWISSKFQSSMTFCKVIYKKCHLKYYHNDIKYYMTLNTIYSVVSVDFQFQGHVVHVASSNFI